MNKKKLLAVAAVVFVAAMISGVAAWLTGDETQTDEIQTGRVSIVLSEANWRPENASDVHPEDILPQNPTVTNSGTTDAYVFVEVRMSALKTGAHIADDRALMELQAPTPLYTTISRDQEYDKLHWQRLVGPVYDEEKNSVAYVFAYASGASMTSLQPGATTPAVFDAVKFINAARRDDVVGLDANVYVRAYAIQTTELGENSAATAPGAVWNIVRNAYDVKLADKTLPQATPKVLQLKPTPVPTPTLKPGETPSVTAVPTPTPSAVPSPTPTAEPTPTPTITFSESWLEDDFLGDDDVLRSFFGEETEATQAPAEHRSVG